MAKPKLYTWSTDPKGKPPSHTIPEAQHQANVKTTGFTPTPAAAAPAGTYDPGLDASERANKRGIGDLQQDTDTSNSRANTQYLAGTEQANTTTGWSLSDLLTNKNNGLQDLRTALSRSEADYTTNTGDLQRNYENLGLEQTGRATSSGLVDTGSIVAAANVRQQNQGRDQGVLDTGITRARQDEATGESRVNSAYDTGVSRTNQQNAWTTAGLQSDYQYGVDDRATTLARALREGSAFSQDTAAAKMYQATTSGLYSPPAPPKNEFTDAKGPYRVIVSHGLRYKMRPNGSREPAGVAH